MVKHALRAQRLLQFREGSDKVLLEQQEANLAAGFLLASRKSTENDPKMS